LNLLG